jgi:thiol-disulfide isomerase/thioredoxin
MHLRRLLSFCTLVCTLTLTGSAQPLAASPGGAEKDLAALVEQITTKLRAGERSPESLAPELAAFDALRVKYRGQKTSEVARIVYMQATLYAQVFQDFERARTLLNELKRDFAGLPEAAEADATIASIEKAEATQRAKNAVIGKPAPDITFTWSTREGLKKLSELKGKVVVIDFWATWCGPCISSFPQVRELTAHYADLDVVVLGVTSIQGTVANLGPSRIDTRNDPAREMALMRDFIKAKNITWPVVFSEQPVFNTDYGVAGIPHMTIIAPDGTVRHNGLHPASPHQEKVQKIDALLKEFGKPTKA